MKVILLGVETYNYTKQDGTIARGGYLHVCSPEEANRDDGKGNVEAGNMVEKIYISKDIISSTMSRLINYIGKEVDIIYERKFGSRYDKIVDVKEVTK